MSATTRKLRKINDRTFAASIDDDTRVWLTIGNLDSFRLAVVALYHDADAINGDPEGPEDANALRLIEETARAMDIDVEDVHDHVAGRLMGIDHAEACVRCGDVEYAPVCPSCVLDAGCQIG